MKTIDKTLPSARVILPMYSTQLSSDERLSLESIYHRLGRYPITVIKPAGLDLSTVLDAYPGIEQVAFGADYFRSIASYNRLMMSEEFYARFQEDEYLLICQLDVFVFRDELAEWCAKGYDYIGAPWLVRPIYQKIPLGELFRRLTTTKAYRETDFMVGNGGFSLRKVASHLKATRELKPVIERFLASPRSSVFNEDVFFSIAVNRHGMHFRYPSWQEALAFSFDKYPELCYKLNQQRLPFGCHSWFKRRMIKFWRPVIARESNW